jgi:stress response protein SCP2
MRENPDIPLNLKRVTKKMVVLGFIAEATNGRTFSEIQRFVVELNGKNYDEMEDKLAWDAVNNCTKVIGKVRRYRGYWSTNLTGYGGSGGMLGKHCVKIKGRYYIKFYSAERPNLV